MDTSTIVATVMDYFEGWFDGDSERMERVLHPNPNKGSVRVDKSGPQRSQWSTATQMIGWSRDGVGMAIRPADLAIKVRVDDVYEQIATVTVHSAVYIEHLQIMRTPDGWHIVNALYMKRK